VTKKNTVIALAVAAAVSAARVTNRFFEPKEEEATKPMPTTFPLRRRTASCRHTVIWAWWYNHSVTIVAVVVVVVANGRASAYAKLGNGRYRADADITILGAVRRNLEVPPLHLIPLEYCLHMLHH
jgi:hypothetical protein